MSGLIGTSLSLFFGPTAHWSEPLWWIAGVGLVWFVIDGFFVKGFLLGKGRRLKLNRNRDVAPVPADEMKSEPEGERPREGGYGFANYGSSNITYVDTKTDSGYFNKDSSNISYTRARDTSGRSKDKDA